MKKVVAFVAVASAALSAFGDVAYLSSVTPSDWLPLDGNTTWTYGGSTWNGTSVSGLRYEKCVELMNVIADADILTSLSVQDGKPQYLLLARKSAYAALETRFPLYRKLEEIASDKQNCTIVGQ